MDEMTALIQLKGRAMHKAASIHSQVEFVAEALDAMGLDMTTSYCGAVDLLRHVATEAKALTDMLDSPA